MKIWMLNETLLPKPKLKVTMVLGKHHHHQLHHLQLHGDCSERDFLMDVYSENKFQRSGVDGARKHVVFMHLPKT